MPKEYESIKASLRKQNPSWNDGKIAQMASMIFYKIYGVTPMQAEDLEKQGKWKPRKSRMVNERKRVLHKIVIDRSKFSNLSSARNWLANHGYASSNVDVDSNSYAFKQKNLIMFDNASLVTLPIIEGIAGVYGVYNNAVRQEHKQARVRYSQNGIEVEEVFEIPNGLDFREGQDVRVTSEGLIDLKFEKEKPKPLPKPAYKPINPLLIIPSEKRETTFTLLKHGSGLFKELRYELGDDCIMWKIHDIKSSKMASLFTNELGMQGYKVPAEEGVKAGLAEAEGYVYVDENTGSVKVSLEDKGRIEFGAQGQYLHEYFLYGKAYNGRYMAIKNSIGRWEIYKPYDQTPYVLNEGIGDSWVPCDGQSALPKEWRDKIPKNLRWWTGNYSREVRQEMIVSTAQYLDSKDKLSRLVAKQPMTNYVSKQSLSASLKMLALTTNSNSTALKLRKKLGLMKFVKFSMTIRPAKMAVHGDKANSFEAVQRNKVPETMEGFELPLMVEGMAFEPGIHHKVNYSREVIKESTPSLKYQRILLNKKDKTDHGKDFLDVSGFITDEVWYDDEADKLFYKGLIYDYETAKAVWNGELSKVSVGTWEQDDGLKPIPNAVKMVYDELSILLFPEVRNASIVPAMR